MPSSPSNVTVLPVDTGDVASLAALAAYLSELGTRLVPSARAEIETLSSGRSLADLAAALRDAISPDSIQAAAALLAANESGCPCSGDDPPEPTPAQLAAAAETLARAALAPLAHSPALRARIFAPQLSGALTSNSPDPHRAPA